MSLFDAIYKLSQSQTKYYIHVNRNDFSPPVPPEITAEPEDATVVRPDNAVFTCSATGRPRPNITWWRVEDDDSMTQIMEMEGVYTIGNAMFGERLRMSTLTIVGVQPSDERGYICRAVNDAGDTEATAMLTVQGIGMHWYFISLLSVCPLCSISFLQ